jgi:MYXO-CTERM domain-containing protein
VDGLKAWDGAAWADPGTEQLQMFQGDATGAFVPGTTVNAITSDAGPFQSMSLAAINPAAPPSGSSVPHSSVSFRLLGDGVASTASSDDGVYLASFRLSSTAVFGASNTPVGDSDPFYFVMYKGSSVDEAMALAEAFAVASGIPLSQVQAAVPEPMGAGLIGLVALARRRRR